MTNEWDKQGAPVDEDEREAAAWLAEGMKQFDERFETTAPDAAQLEAFVRQARRDARRKLRRELALLWTVGCAGAAGIGFLLAESPALFLALQGAGFAAGALGLAALTLRNPIRRWKGKWTE